MPSRYARRFRRSSRPARFPSSTYGRVFVPRGTEFSLERYGATANLATPLQLANRRLDGWVGQGKYTGGLDAWAGQGKYNAGRNFRKWATGAVRNVGRGVGAALNQQLLGGIEAGGDYAGTGVYTGRGLYSANNLIESPGSRQSMEFSSDNDETQALVISHKEYVGDVFAPSTAAFSNTSYSINPGLQQNFPFLAQFAQNFDEYELIQMVWEFHSTIDASATNNTAGNTGTIVMATNYKADAHPFTTKEEMIQYHGGVSGRLTEQLSHGVECDPSKNSGSAGKYIRTAPVVGGDIKSFDVGLFQLALQNIPSAFFSQQVGELWVYYKVKLSKPKLFASLGNGIVASRYISAGGEGLDTRIMGNNMLSANNNSISALITNSGLGVFVTFPAALSGVFEIKLLMEGTGFVASAPNAPGVGGNIIGWNDLYASTYDNSDSPAYYSLSSSDTTTTVITRVSIKAATGGVDNEVYIYPLGFEGIAETITQSYLEISEIGTGFATSNSVQTPVWLNSKGVISSPIVA